MNRAVAGWSWLSWNWIEMNWIWGLEDLIPATVVCLLWMEEPHKYPEISSSTLEKHYAKLGVLHELR